MNLALPTYAEVAGSYRNTAEHNDALHRQFNELVARDDLLAGHRRHVETHRLGFGDPAFHVMWAILLAEASRRFGPFRAMEIGVFKGQVISLWALLAARRRFQVEIHAVTPLAGQPPPSRLWGRLLYLVSRRHRERVENGDFYPQEDYERIVREHFAFHGADFNSVILHRGFSTDPALLASIAPLRIHLLYVDGDHTLAGARHDFSHFGPKVVTGGWLVADDAGCDLPGTSFWKGHKAVSRAASLLPSLGFRNVFNVGHNRVYERIG